MSARYEEHTDPRLPSETRADFLGKTAAAGIAYAAALWPRRVGAVDLGGVEFGPSEPNKFDIPPEDNPDGLRSPRPLAYRVEYTDPPTTIPFPRNMEDRLVAEMASQKLLFFGVHGDSPADQQLAARLMGKIASKLKDKAAIGLEQVERQFQSALDDYVAEGRTPGASEPGELLDQADARLAEATQWKERSTLPFDSYRPVFHLARRRGLPLVALGVDSESVFQVMRNGMDSLREEDRNSFVADFKGFVSYVRDKGFQAYADKLIFPSYERLMDEGLLGDTPPTRPNFFSARILVDEALASRAVEWVTSKANQNRPLLVLQREDRVKFGFGASGRAARIAESFGGKMPTRTVLVNPTAIDSLSDNRSLRLALEYADDLYAGKPLANYLWFTKSPKVSLIPRMLNPENKGWLENINLYELRGSAKT
ncbi:unnamed protein product [Ascophyllum nodosum]